MKKFSIIMLLTMAGMVGLHAQEIGNAAPDFEVNLLGGGTFKLSQHRGQVVLVFLFGNRCPPCIAAGPKIESLLYQEYMNTSNFAAIGVDTWNSSSNATSVAGFQNLTGISFPLAIKAGSVAVDYGTTYDRLMIIDQEGILVHKGRVTATNDVNNAIEAINMSLAVTNVGIAGDGPEVGIFPNPVSDEMRIDAGDKTVAGIEIYDVSGKRVHEASFSGHDPFSPVSLSLSGLEQGIYFYKIALKGEKYLSTGKLLIQR